MMKSRSSLSVLTLGAALLVTTSLSVSVTDALARNLQPKTSWSTTMVDGDVPENGYCALTRKYDDNLVLTIGQSARDEYSMAIDFQGQKLNVEKAYNIILQAGVAQTRTYDVLPASSQAIVMRLGYEEGFVNELRKTKQLTVRIDGEDYNFDVSDFSKGQIQLRDCMAGLKGVPTIPTTTKFAAEKIENAAPIVASKPSVVPAPVVVAEPPIIAAPAPVVVAEPPVIAAPAPVIVAETPVIAAPAPVVVPAPIVVAAAPVEVQKETFVAQLEPPKKIETQRQESVLAPRIAQPNKRISQRPVLGDAVLAPPAIKRNAGAVSRDADAPKIVVHKPVVKKEVSKKKIDIARVDTQTKAVALEVKAPKVKASEVKVPEVKENVKVAKLEIPKAKKSETKTIKLKRPEKIVEKKIEQKIVNTPDVKIAKETPKKTLKFVDATGVDVQTDVTVPPIAVKSESNPVTNNAPKSVQKSAPKKFVSIVPTVGNSSSERPTRLAAQGKKYSSQLVSNKSSKKEAKPEDVAAIKKGTVDDIIIVKKNPASVEVKEKIETVVKKEEAIKTAQVNNFKPIAKSDVPKPFEKTVKIIGEPAKKTSVIKKEKVSSASALDIPDTLKAAPKPFSKKTEKPKSVKSSNSSAKLTLDDLKALKDKETVKVSDVKLEDKKVLSPIVADIPDALKAAPKPFSSKVEKPRPPSSSPSPAKLTLDDLKELEDKDSAALTKPAPSAKKAISISKPEPKIESIPSVVPTAKVVANKPDPKTQQELAQVKDELKELEKENRALYLEARKARGEIDGAVVQTSNEALKRIRGYEKKLEAANADNLALARQVEELRRAQEEAQLGGLSGDAATQQSLKRYHEAEREIQRLGLLLEQQRLAHSQERTELEGMLFDPAVTEDAQRRKLTDLESQLTQAQQRLKAESQRVSKVDSESQKKLKALQAELTAAQQKEDQLKVEQQKVKIEAEKIAVAEAKLKALSEKETLLKAKEQNLLSEKAKLSSAQQTLAQAELKSQELAAKEQALAIEAQKVAAAEAKLVELRQKEQALAIEKQRLAAKEVAAQKRLADAARKEQEIQGQKKLLAQQAQQGYSSERLTARDPLRVVSAAPKALLKAPSGAQGIASQAVASSAKVAPVAFTSGNLQQLLNQSGISSVTRVAEQTAGRYSWRAAGLTGKAEVRSTTANQSLDQFSRNYIEREKRNCRGDFASLPARVPNGKKGVEIACVGGGVGKSSSVVFAQKNGNYIAISHETSAENMDSAIDVRDKVASRL